MIALGAGFAEPTPVADPSVDAPTPELAARALKADDGGTGGGAAKVAAAAGAAVRFASSLASAARSGELLAALAC